MEPQRAVLTMATTMSSEEMNHENDKLEEIARPQHLLFGVIVW
jgi:hypothetical protein